jgi:hypothetical protein
MRRASTDQPYYSILRRRTTLPQLGGLRLPSSVTTVSYPMSYTDGIQTARPPRGLPHPVEPNNNSCVYNRNWQNGHQPILAEAVARAQIGLCPVRLAWAPKRTRRRSPSESLPPNGRLSGLSDPQVSCCSSADRSLPGPLGCPSQADKETVPLRVPVSQWSSQRSSSLMFAAYPCASRSREISRRALGVGLKCDLGSTRKEGGKN